MMMDAGAVYSDMIPIELVEYRTDRRQSLLGDGRLSTSLHARRPAAEKSGGGNDPHAFAP